MIYAFRYEGAYEKRFLKKPDQHDAAYLRFDTSFRKFTFCRKNRLTRFSSYSTEQANIGHTKHVQCGLTIKLIESLQFHINEKIEQQDNQQNYRNIVY